MQIVITVGLEPNTDESRFVAAAKLTGKDYQILPPGPDGRRWAILKGYIDETDLARIALMVRSG